MDSETLEARLRRVRERMDTAAGRTGRTADDVTLVAVTKTHAADAVLAARDAGIADVGENRVQELEEKVAAAGRETARWHLIGHLQRNKVRRVLPLFDLLHSLDSPRLARKLSSEAAEAGVEVEALVQVNTSGEESKYGFDEENALEALTGICVLPSLRIRGLMTMAPYTDDERVLRRTFAACRELQQRAAREVAGFSPDHLSMGMSNDFEIAIEEGSTMVRLGTVLFGERE